MKLRLPTVLLALALHCLVAAPQGRWDLQVTGHEIRFPAWLEIANDGGKTTVRYVGRVGSVRDIRDFTLNEDRLVFSRNEWFGAYEILHHEFILEGERVSGTLRRINGDTLTVSGQRAPALTRPEPQRWSTPRPLFNGRDFSGWTASRGSDRPENWRVRDGELITFHGGGDLRTVEVFTDFKAHLEFNCPPNGNSGVYLRGRYELQIEDDSPKAPLAQQTGGLYGWIGPEKPVARQPNAWHSLDITLIGRRVTVVLDGATLYAHREIPGITGGALDSNEASPGPLVLQSSHSKTRGEVRFRAITIATPAR